jgi:hypothetical protein
MATFHEPPASRDELPERAEYHAQEAERLLKSWFLSSHVKGQLHAALALYYSGRASAPRGPVTR